MTEATRELSDDTTLASVLTSQKAIKALKDAGIMTVGDVRKRAIEELSSIRGVGDSTLDFIRHMGVPEKMAPSEELEEGAHPIELRSPFPGYRIRLLRGDAVFNGPSVRVIQPVFVDFKEGVGQLKRETFLMAKHFRDEQKVREEMSKPVEQAPWRREAGEWLKQRNAYKRKQFIILFD